jgi:hypothetical protein
VGERGGLGGALNLARLGHQMQAGSAAGKDLAASAFVAVHPQGTVLQSRPQRVAKVLLAVVRPAVESQRRLLVDVLELLGAQSPALRKAAGDSQLAGLPFPEDLTDPLRAECPPGTRTWRNSDRSPWCATGPLGS